MESIKDFAMESVKPIKRPLSAYMIFSAHERERMKEGPKLSFTESTKYISKRWSEIDETEKQKYANLAEQDKQRYKRETDEAGVTGRKVVSIKKSKVKRRQKIIGGPKKAMSSFLLYCQDKRPEVKAELGEASQSIAQVGKRLGQMWQEESAEVKQRYKERADLDKMRYERELLEFQQQQLEGDPSVEMDSD